MIEERVYVETQVDSDRNGRKDRVAIDISRPAGTTRVPVVFEHSPYREGLNDAANYGVNVDRLPQESLSNALTSAAAGLARSKAMPDLPEWYDDYFVPRGYAVVMGQSIGTGASDGCPTSGDMQETLGATAVIDWLNGRASGYNAAGRPVEATWSTGNVGMIGVSYNGTLPNMAAATGVEGLKAIVPISAISNWYDYYRANGLVVAPGGYQGEDADVLAKAVVKRNACGNEIAEITRNQDRVTGDETAFWQARDYVSKASNVKAATFIIHGQNDWNVKGQQYSQWWDALRANNVPRKIWLHRGGHGTASRSDYQATVLRWFDHYLKGIDNGIENEPMAEVQYTDGSWKQYGDWPDPAARDAVFNLEADTATAPGALSLTNLTGDAKQTFTDAGRTRNANSLVASPDRADANRLVYRSTALTSAVRLSGVPKVTLRMSIDNRKAANVTALLVDYGPVGGTAAPTVVTRGWIDPQNRTSNRTSEPIVAGQEYPLTFAMQPKDYVFAAGRRIGLTVISTDYDYTLRPLAGTQLSLNPAASTLSVPVVGLAQDTSDFSMSLSPTSGAVDAGATVKTTVTTQVTKGGAQQVRLTTSGLPAGATATFDPQTIQSGQPSSLTIATAQSTPAGTYPVTVTATGADATRTATYQLTVRDVTTPRFTMSLEPKFGSVKPGGSVTSTVQTQNTTSQTQSVELSASGLPTGATATFNPTTLTSGQSSQFTITTTASTPAGTYPVSVTGTGQHNVDSKTFTLTVAADQSSCDSMESRYTGTLSSGGTAYQPNNSYFLTNASGLHEACLDGPTGTDFDLYLQRWSGSKWTTVARGITATADETLSYNGNAGYYRYQITAYSGSGAYTLGYNAP